MVVLCIIVALLIVGLIVVGFVCWELSSEVAYLRIVLTQTGIEVVDVRERTSRVTRRIEDVDGKLIAVGKALNPPART